MIARDTKKNINQKCACVFESVTHSSWSLWVTRICVNFGARVVRNEGTGITICVIHHTTPFFASLSYSCHSCKLMQVENSRGCMSSRFDTQNFGETLFESFICNYFMFWQFYMYLRKTFSQNFFEWQKWQNLHSGKLLQYSMKDHYFYVKNFL